MSNSDAGKDWWRTLEKLDEDADAENSELEGFEDDMELKGENELVVLEWRAEDEERENGAGFGAKDSTRFLVGEGVSDTESPLSDFISVSLRLRELWGICRADVEKGEVVGVMSPRRRELSSSERKTSFANECSGYKHRTHQPMELNKTSRAILDL